MIYLDAASTTPVGPDVYRTIQPYFCNVYSNPSSLHSTGRKARRAVEKAREQCALALGCEPSQIFFTSGGTESDNWAIQMHHEYLGQWMSPNNKILYSSIEHKAILNSIDKQLDIPIPVDENGIVDASVDKIKRLGSLTSTGINNRLDFEDFDSDYVCAELKDFEIGSRQFTDTLVPMFVDSSIREVVKQVHGIKATLKEDGSNKSIEELKEEFPQEANLATVRAKKEVAGYGDGINVADAAVYVTPEFYAKMMRSIGMWSPEI